MASTAPDRPPAADSPQCLTTNLGWLLSHADHVLGTEVAVALAPLGLGSRGYCVLATALRSELTQKELADLIGLDKTTMVVTVDELERAGLAERKPSRTDRRARVIAVTKAGERRVAEGHKIIDAVQSNVLSALPAAERKAFLSALMRLVSGRLSEPVECNPPLRRREPRA
jgi:MarR family transcriptional regulator, transcriptional regulator for hemolysin